jgi:dTDP-4-dehydrorhamnose 3,5-epimerase
MKVINTEIPEVLIFEPNVIADERGFFLETFQAAGYAAHGITRLSVQDNLSRSRRGVLRGLHLQNPRCQGKLVTAVQGSVLDVVVDVRTGSPTFGHHVAVELGNLRQLWIPRGFAHGFVVLSESADLSYRCDEAYSPADEICIRWNDPALAIDWRCEAPIISARDANAPLLSEASRLPVYGEV